MKNYRLRPDLREIDDCKDWLLEESEGNGPWKIIDKGTYQKVLENFHKHKEDQKEEEQNELY